MSDVQTGGYYDRVNHDLLNAIPPDARCVLEAGCGTGALARAYRGRNPLVRWDGIESNVAAADEAMKSKAIDGITCRDVETLGGCTFGEPDVIVFGDVLEHLEDPWQVVKDFAAMLEDGGQFLACVPNAQHYSIIHNLNNGFFDYESEGLMDRTHLRWFTRKSIVDMFEAAGLTVFDVSPRVFFADGHDWFVKQYQPREMTDPVTIAEWRADTKAYQWVVRAVKGGVAERVLIRGIPSEACCANHRLTWPGMAMATVPGVRYSEVPTEVRPGERVVVIRQRKRFNAEEVKRQVDSGCLVVAEWDDDPTADHFRAIHSPDFLCLRMCHAVSVSTPEIAEVVSRWNPNVGVFPNHLPELPPARKHPEEPRDVLTPPIRIFFGAQNREADWLPIMPTLNRMLASQGILVEMVVVHDRKFFKALETDFKIYHSFLPYDRYRSLLRTCDIAILPLEDTQFNRCKSDVKFLECAAEGVAVLASATVYADSVVGDVDLRGLIYETAEEFGIQLDDMIRNPALRAELTLGARRYLSASRLHAWHYRGRLSWYLALLASQGELTEDLKARTKEVAW